MSLSEFQLIDRYFNRPLEREDIVVGIGDDTAVIAIPDGKQLLGGSQTTGFDYSDDPRLLASGLVQDAVAELQKQQADPAWATLALCLDSVNENWLQDFSDALLNELGKVDMPLVGGDTTRGQNQLTLFCHGYKEI